MDLEKILKLKHNKCVWKFVAEHQKESYPTFSEDKECLKHCDGYNFDCKQYSPMIAYNTGG